MLTPHQEEIKNRALDKLKEHNKVLIKGSAGVGKTYTVEYLIKDLLKDKINPVRRKIFITAPTNTAVEVLQNKINLYNSKILFMTIHKALGVKSVVNEEKGIKEFKIEDKTSQIKDADVIIVDEVSMLSTYLLDNLLKLARNHNTKLIFLGDDKQLNPVNEEDSPIFHKDIPEVELEEIVRQEEGNPIIFLSRNLQQIFKKEEKYQDGKGYVYTWDKERIISLLSKNPNTRYLAWTNKEVNSMNNAVRKVIFGEEAKKIEKGDFLIFSKPYKKYKTNSILTVDNVVEVTLPFFYTANGKTNKINFKVYSVNPEKDTLFKEWIHKVLIIHEEEAARYKYIKSKITKSIRNKQARWKDYFDFTDYFADVKYAYAMTVHRSQGKTYEKVVVNVKDIIQNQNKSERNRLLYTAITRAAKAVIFYKTP